MGQKEGNKISKGARKSDVADAEVRVDITLFRLRKKLLGLGALLSEMSYLPYEIAAVGSEGTLEPLVMSKKSYGDFVAKTKSELDNARRLFVVYGSLKKAVKTAGSNHTIQFESEKISIEDANEKLDTLRLEHKFLIELGRNRQKMIENVGRLTAKLEEDRAAGLMSPEGPTAVINYTLVELPDFSGSDLLEQIKAQEKRIDDLQDLLTEAEAGILVTVDERLLS